MKERYNCFSTLPGETPRAAVQGEETGEAQQSQVGERDKCGKSLQEREPERGELQRVCVLKICKGFFSSLEWNIVIVNLMCQVDWSQEVPRLNISRYVHEDDSGGDWQLNQWIQIALPDMGGHYPIH